MSSAAATLALMTVLSLSLALFARAEPEAANDAPPRAVHFSTGYFAPPIELPARSGTLSVSAIELTAEAWTDDGGPARLLLDESRLNFNLFGDATVEEKKGGTLEVNCERMPIDDPSGEDRLLYHLRLQADTLLDQVYLAVSPRGIGPHRLLIAAKEIPLAADPRGRRDVALNHVLPMREAGDDAAEGALPAGEAWQPTRISLGTHHYWEGTANEKRRSHTQINGLLNGSGHLAHDPNDVFFDAFGDLAGSTAMGFFPPPIVFKEMQTPDPAGLGRRLFNLLRDESQKMPFGEARWPFGRYVLVLYPTRNGPHRLVVRNANNTVAQVLPLHDATHQYFERRIASLKGAADELRPIEALGEILGEGSWFDVKNGHVETLRLSGELNLRAALPLAARLPHLKQLHLSGNPSCDATALAALREMDGLESLSFYIFSISNDVLALLEGHEELKGLRVYDEPPRGTDPLQWPHVTDAGLKCLETLPNLEYLGLWGPGITDVGLPHLAGLSKLRRLEIHQSRVTLAGCFELLRQLPNAALYCDQWEIDLAKGRFGSNSGHIDDELMAEICKHEELITVQIAARQVTDRGLEHLPALASLTNLLLTNAPTITDEGLRHIAKLAGLKRLSLWYCSEVTDAGLEHLAALNDLEELELGGTKATPAGVEALRAKLPKCKIKKEQ